MEFTELKALKITLQVKYEGTMYFLRIRKTVYKGIEMYYEDTNKNFLFQTWRNADTIDELVEKWDKIFELNNINENEKF